jgi:hypothetical protein
MLIKQLKSLCVSNSINNLFLKLRTFLNVHVKKILKTEFYIRIYIQAKLKFHNTREKEST